MSKEVKCPHCGNTDNFHFNYDWSKRDLPVMDVLCNECGETFKLEENA